MKTKTLSLKLLMLLLFTVSTMGVWAQNTDNPTHVCFNSYEDYWVENTVGSTYNWVLSGGGTIESGQGTNQITIHWTATGTYILEVTETFTSTTGCEGETVTLNIIVDPLPIVTLDGPTPVCVNSTGNVYATEAGMTDYIWTVSAGGTITAGGGINDSTVTITWNTASPQTVSVNYTNGDSCTAAAATVFDVTVNPLPVVTLAGPTPVCVNSTGNVYTTEAGMTDYIWTVSAGGTITAGGTALDNTVTITWNTASPQSVSVNYTNGDNCTAAAATVFDVIVNPLPIVTLDGPTPVCVNSTGNVYTTEAGMTDYIWTVSAGGTITAGGTALDNTVTITWNTASPQTVSVNYTNGDSCTAAEATLFDVTVDPLPATSPIWHN